MRLSALAIAVAVIAAVQAERNHGCVNIGGRIICYNNVNPATASASSTIVEPEPCKIGGGRQCKYLVEPSAVVAAAIEPATIKPDNEPEPCKSGGGRRCQYLVKPSVTNGAVESTGDANIKSCKLVRGNLWCLCGRNEWCPAF